MSLEGKLRELALPEVLQLLGLSRKTGRLQLRAQLQGRGAFVRLAQGAVVDAAQWRLHDEADRSTHEGLAQSANATRAVEGCVLDLLTWRDGDFRFVPEAAATPTSVRIAVEMLLVEAAQRAERWDGLVDRIAHAHVVPAFVDVEPQQLPLLRLVPQEWEILTRVDGKRDLTELAEVLGREVLDVADIVHGLIGSGLLALRDAERVPRRNPTPPSGTTVARDLWVPHGDDVLTSDLDHAEDDSIFDPIEMGVLNADGMPRTRATPHRASSVLVREEARRVETVAPMLAEPSLHQEEARGPEAEMDAPTLCSHGDEAARRGDLAGALTFWSAALRSEASLADADRIREAIALAARLHALLHPAARRT
jgi:hypothetical protein